MSNHCHGFLFAPLSLSSLLSFSSIFSPLHPISLLFMLSILCSTFIFFLLHPHPPFSFFALHVHFLPHCIYLMDASESPLNSSPNHHSYHHPHPRNSHVASPYQTNPDTTATKITHLRNYSTYLYRHHPQPTHRSDQRVRCNDTPGLGAQNSLERKGASQSASDSIQQQQRQQQHQQPKLTEAPLLHTSTLVNPTPPTRFNFAAFWNPQRLFSAARSSSNPSLPPPPPSPLPSTASPDPLRPSSSETVTTSSMSDSGETVGDNSTPKPDTKSKLSSSSLVCSLVAQDNSSSQGGSGGPRQFSVSVKPASASTTTPALLPPNSDPGPSMSSSGRRQHQYNQSQFQQALGSAPGGFNTLSIPKGGSYSSSTYKDGRISNSGGDSNSCYPSPTSPDSLSTCGATLEWVQKRITQDQAHLVQYTNMIQKHETDRAGYVTLQTSHQKQREVLESEIEILESAIRQGPSTPVSPLSSFFSSANILFGKGGGIGSSTQGNLTKRSPPSFFSWSSPPYSYEGDRDCHQEQNATCCPFKSASTRVSATASFLVLDTIAIAPITSTSNVTPITAFPRRLSTGAFPITTTTTTTTAHAHNRSLSPISPCNSSPFSSAPFVSGDPIRSRSTSSLRVTFSSSGSSSSLSSSKPCVSDCQSQDKSRPIISTLPFLSIPLALPTMPSTSSEATAAPLRMCRRCFQKATLTERRDQLKGIQRRIDQVQQKIHSTNSQIRHLQRTFVLPIETCLEEDREELSRLQQLQAIRTQKESQQQVYHGSDGGSRPSSGSNLSASRGAGGSAAIY